MTSPYPSVDALVRAAAVEAPHALLVDAARTVIAERRESGHPAAAGDLAAEVRARVAAALAPGLRRVLNATGVIVHTNLGRAPLAAVAAERAAKVGAGYSNLELDLQTGRRGSRQAHVEGLVCELTGAGAAMAVNNGAAAILLTLAALAEGREVIVSRGQLVEIGDGFRIPDVLARSGARLVEVGSTNRTRIADYAEAISPATAAILHVHPSNYRVVGFAEEARLADLAALGRQRELLLVDDAGSGVLRDDPLWPGEPSARASLAAGADVVCFSGDKLLGGPQAGIIAGSVTAVERIRRHPLGRALRIDKLCLAALEATLDIHRDPVRARAELPVLRAASEPLEVVRARAKRLAERTGGTVVESVARVGGGALPLHDLPSFAVALTGDADAHAARLRARDPAVLARIADGMCLLDCRTLSDADVDLIA
jgi:L-seryl-tRNA(Ser) seleniumtransferase